jgi:hypothetical protein
MFFLRFSSTVHAAMWTPNIFEVGAIWGNDRELNKLRMVFSWR